MIEFKLHEGVFTETCYQLKITDDWFGMWTTEMKNHKFKYSSIFVEDKIIDWLDFNDIDYTLNILKLSCTSEQWLDSKYEPFVKFYNDVDFINFKLRWT